MKNEYYHDETKAGWKCSATGKAVDYIWSDHSRAGTGNSCEFCNTGPGPKSLQELNEERKKLKQGAI